MGSYSPEGFHRRPGCCVGSRWPSPGRSAWSASGTGSAPDALLCRLPQPMYIAHGWDAEEAFVLPIEVGNILVAHAVGRPGRVQVFTQQQPARLQKPQPFLILQGTQRCDGLEVVVQPRDAHPQFLRQLLDT